jgi:hypothetical protein
MTPARAIVLALAVVGTLAAAGSTRGAADGTPVPSAEAPIAVGIDAGGGPYVTTWERDGTNTGGFLPYFDFSVGGVNVASGDVDGDARDEIVTAPGSGGRGEIRVFEASGERARTTALASTSGCGTRVAVGDVTGDGKAELVSGSERCAPHVQVFDGVSGDRISFFDAFQTGGGDHGIRVAAGDVTGDGRAELILGTGPADPPVVRVFQVTPSVAAPRLLRTFTAFESSVANGLEVAAADLDRDGGVEIVVGAETADDAQIRVFDGATGRLRASFRPFGLVSGGTLRVAAGDVDGDGIDEIVAAAKLGHLPTARVFTEHGELVAQELSPLWSGRSMSVGDLDGDGKAEIQWASGPGHESAVVSFDLVGGVETWFQAYGYSFTNGVRVAAGDVDGNGTIEYVTGQGPGGNSLLVVSDAVGDALLERQPFGSSWHGLFVAVGDLDGDARADIVASADSWTEPRVVVYDGSGTEKASFLAFDASFQGGVRVAAGDVDGDGRSEIIAAAGPGGPPVVRIFDATGRRRASFFGADAAFAGGLYVAAGDVDDDGEAEIVLGSGTEGDVRLYEATGELVRRFTAYEPRPEYGNGVRVSAGDANGDGKVEIVTTPGGVHDAEVRIFDAGGSRTGSFAVHADYRGGLYVAVPPALGPRLVLTAPTLRALEGRPVRVRATFVDASGGATPEIFAARVHWREGVESSVPVRALGGGRYLVEAVRTFPYGRHPVSFHVADIHLRGAAATTVARIDDAPLTAVGRVVRTRGRRFDGVVALLRDSDRTGSSLDLSVRLLWGDGQRSSARIVGFGPGRFRISGTHEYRKPGRYTVQVLVRSRGGSRAFARTTIRVSTREP